VLSVPKWASGFLGRRAHRSVVQRDPLTTIVA
jgi:hypothetical protein